MERALATSVLFVLPMAFVFSAVKLEKLLTRIFSKEDDDDQLLEGRSEPETLSNIFHGNLHCELGDFEKAEEYFRGALSIVPGAKAAMYGLARIHIERKELNYAFRLLRVVFPEKTNLTSAINYLAMSYTARENNEKAIELLKYALTKCPKDYLLLFNLGGAYTFSARYEEAIDIFRKAARLTKYKRGCYEQIAVAYELMNNYAEAIAVYSRILKINPLDPPIWMELGKAYYHIDEYEKALSCFIKVIALDPNHVQAYTRLADVHRIERRCNEALSCAGQALWLAPDDAEANFIMGLIYEDLGDKQLAREYNIKAAKIDSKYQRYPDMDVWGGNDDGSDS